MVPFVKRFDGKDDDPYILEKITTKEELEGMLIFALQGLTRLKEQGHFTGDLDANETRERWKYMVDPIVRFMMEFVENTMESSDMIPVSELRDHYIRYSGKRVSPAVFNDRVTMAAETWQSVHGGKGQKIRVWRGIRWKNGPPASITPGKDDENGGGRSTEIKANCAFDKNVDHYKSLLDMDTIRPGVIDSGEKIATPATPKGVTLSEYAKRVSVRNDGGGDDVEDDVEDADDEPEEVGHDFVY